VRFIEFMPFDAHQLWESGEHFASAADLVAQIKALYPGIEPAPGTRTEHYIFQAPGHAGKIAVIPAYSRDLCGNCSRIRLTSDGSIINCLYSHKEFRLRDVLRDGGSDEDIANVLRQAYSEKTKNGWDAKKLADDIDTSKLSRASMTQIGG